MKNSQFGFLWFLIGLGSSLQIVASLSIAESICLGLAPLWFFQDIPSLKKHGVMTFLKISFLVVLGGLVSCLWNKTPGYFFLRGMAVACLLPAAIIVGHHLLWKGMAEIKWYFVGAAISAVLSTFVFQAAVEVNQLAGGVQDSETASMIMSGPLYWIGRLGGFIALPIKGWYLQTPLAYSGFAPFALAAFAMLTSQSGRAAALTSIVGGILVFIGGKTRLKMKRFSKYFFLLMFCGILLLFALKSIYRMAALSGTLGEGARDKYMTQTKGKSGFMALLLGGRLGSFVGYFACIDRPIVGFGAYPVDDKCYMESFMVKYGNEEDVQAYLRNLEYEARRGVRDHLIPAHSCVVVFWLQYGICGLIFWVYVLWVFYRFVRYNVAAVPQWFGWLACGMSSYLWAAFFSPFNSRVGLPFFVVGCLMAEAVRRGRLYLPMSMLREINKAEKR